MELQVVKNVASQSLEVKKLAYLYLLHYAEKYATVVKFLIIELILMNNTKYDCFRCFLHVKLGFE